MTMSKLRFPLVALAVGVLFSITACQSQGATLEENPSQESYYGKVLKAVGNEITLAVGTPVTQNQGVSSGSDSPPVELDPGGEAPSDRGGGSPSQEGGRSRSGADGEGAGQGTERRGITLELTGEERELTIPVGVSVTRTMDNRTVKTSFTQISEDNILQIITQTVDSGQAVVEVRIIS